MDPQAINLNQTTPTGATPPPQGTPVGAGTGGTAVAQTAVIIDHANNPAIPEKVRNYWKEIEAKYVVPRLVRETYPQLIPLIKETESMNDEEREYWFQILPIMTEDQIKKFVGILDNEKQQLNKLDKEYEDELSKLNDKHDLEWDAFEAKKKRDEIKQKEQVTEQSESKAEENLLGQLNNI